MSATGCTSISAAATLVLASLLFGSSALAQPSKETENLRGEVERLRRQGATLRGWRFESRPETRNRGRASGISGQKSPSASLGPDRKVNIQGDVVQLGLTKRELDALWRRIERLLEQADEERLEVF